MSRIQRDLALITLLSLGAVPTAWAAGDLDQSFDFVDDGSFVALPISSSFPKIELAQTFTVGRDGTLGCIEVFVYGGGPLILEVQSTAGGLPDGTVIAAATVELPSPPPDPCPFPNELCNADYVNFDLTGAGLMISAGDVLAIVLRVAGPETGYIWIGKQLVPVTYPGGAAYIRDVGFFPWEPATVDGGDLHFRTYVLGIEIDIKPGNDANPVNVFAPAVIPVAILGTDGFDVQDVEPSTLAFGPDGAPLAHTNGPHYADVNDDGFEDLLGHFATPETGIAPGDTETCLTGELLDGTPFEACDEFKTVPACGIGFELAFLLPPLMWFRQRCRHQRCRSQSSRRLPLRGQRRGKLLT